VRIAHLTATFPPYLGGAGTVAFNLARGLSLRGHDVEVITAAAGGVPPAVGRARVRRLPAVLAVGNAPLLPGLLRAGGHDVVHLHHPFIFGTELTLLRRLRAREAPLVVSYHNRLVGEGSRRALFRGWEETVERALLAAADRVCVLSEAHAASVPTLARLARRRPERISVLPNGVDLERFRPGAAPQLRRELGLPEDAIVAAFVATLDRAHYLKRPDRAIEALARTRDARLHLLVVGGGEDLERHRGAAVAAGVGDRVHFAGAADHDRLPELLRAADLMLLSSDLESFGIVLLEGMACGLPTVATDLVGVSSVGIPGETGLLARPEPGALAAALDRLAALDPEVRRRMGAAGRAHVEERYSWASLVVRLERVYAEVLEEPITRRIRGRANTLDPSRTC
jgi:glycosyltransferase involved in cell wall biosynthesis